MSARGLIDRRGLRTLTVSNLSYIIGGKSLVSGVSFSVPLGTLTALIGPNGAGKSTLLHLISGAIRATGAAAVNLDGRDLLALPRRDRAQLVALVEQRAETEFALTVAQAVGLGRIPFRSNWFRQGDEAAIVRDAMRLAGVEQWATRYLSTLSGGERQRVALARALAQQPRLLLLDEPTNNLDIAAQLGLFELVRKLVARERLTAVIALHDLAAAAQYADYVVALKGGRLDSAAATSDILNPAFIRRVYGVAASFLTDPITGQRVLSFRQLSPSSRR